MCSTVSTIGLAPYHTYRFPGGRSMTVCWDDYKHHAEPIKTIYAPHYTTIWEWLHGYDFNRAVTKVFYEMDKDGNRKLEWNNGEIRNFIKKVLAMKGLPDPGELRIYDLYTRFDADCNNALDLEEAQNLAHAYLSILLRCGSPTTTAVKPTPTTYVSPSFWRSPVGATTTYSFNFDDHKDLWQAFALFYKPHISVIDGWIDSASFATDVRTIFDQVDRAGDGNGTLDWNSREVYNFIKKILALKGLPHYGDKDDRIIYELYRIFDRNGDHKLDFEECKQLTHALLSGISYHVVQGGLSLSPVYVSPAPTTTTTTIYRPARNYDYTAYGSLFDWLYGGLSVHSDVITTWVNSSLFSADVDAMFTEIDKDGSKSLTWNNREIFNFIKGLFAKKGWPHIGDRDDTMFYQLYQDFDDDRSNSLDRQECQNLARFIFSGIAHRHKIVCASQGQPLFKRFRSLF